MDKTKKKDGKKIKLHKFSAMSTQKRGKYKKNVFNLQMHGVTII